MMSDIVDFPKTNDTSASLRFWDLVSQRLTLWSDGRVNAITADPSTLNALWHLEFKSDAPDQILAIGQQPSPSNFHDLLGKSGLTSSQTQFAREWLTTNSNTFSIWIDSPNRAGKSFTAIYVRRRSTGFADEQFGFHLP